jgi:hypothetical protein
MIETQKISEALISLGYTTGWVVTGTEITWVDEPAVKPTQEQIDDKVLEIESILEAKAQEERALKVSAYKKLGLTEAEINTIL